MAAHGLTGRRAGGTCHGLHKDLLDDCRCGHGVVDVTSTGAIGACKTTLRGELVQAPAAPVLRPAYPKKFLFFDLIERTPGNPAGSHQRFQSFVVPNTSTTLPIPFELNIDSPRDCPGEVEFHVAAEDSDQPPGFRFGSYEPALRGYKMISLDKFEIIPVWGPYF